ncbi:MAG: ketohydroxyglutarate aldolase [Leptolyngbyaceae cyanobacterium MAG.088]|nr:ketohydroxyglutarate aldolase [Leptolyngbyaceae cyanobacterium MAG.088]
MSKVQVTISVDDAHLEQLDQVAEQLKEAGLEVDQTMSTLGIVTGSVDSEKMSALSDVVGVESVEVDKTITLPPPGSDVQ